MIASEPPGENWEVHRMHRAPFAMWRTNPPLIPVDGQWWDLDRKLQKCIQLSRLIHPSTIAYQYACRVSYRDGERTIQPAGIVGQGAHADTMNVEDDSIRDVDVVALKALINAYESAALPNRVKNALWMNEHVAATRLMNIRWPLAVTALEAMVHTDDRGRKRGRILGSTEQFCLRLAKLQALIGLSLWSEPDLQSIYDLRSSFAHGRGGTIDSLRGEPLRLYCSVETGLRRILRVAIERPEVADIFRSDGSIRSALHF